MREIKFRAWDRKEKKWLAFDEGEPIDFDYSGLTEKGYWSFKFSFDEDRVCLMQFTGIHDKSGKEVYEGDIVRLPNKDICEIRYKADWDYSGFLAISITKLYGTESYKYWSGEVIGNIYENKELLEEV